MKRQLSTPNIVSQLLGCNNGISRVGAYDPRPAPYDNSTSIQYVALEKVANYFNARLFHSRLTGTIYSQSRYLRVMGCFLPYGWKNENTVTAEITINPYVVEISEKELCQTIVHEQAHLFQHLYGTPGRRGYHNEEFAEIMEALGLACSDTGQVGGKRTGDHMLEYAMEGGLFLQVFNELPTDFLLPFFPISHPFTSEDPPTMTPQKPSYGKDKIKYQCPKCRIAVWGKPSLYIVCGTCQKTLDFNTAKSYSL
jgi:hypothetical protein